MSSSPDFIDKLDFLKIVLPEIDKIAKKGRDRLCRSFKEIQLNAGVILFKEGVKHKNAYLIRVGEIDLYCSKPYKGHINEMIEKRKSVSKSPLTSRLIDF
jgi:hypothetical protein